MIHTRGSLPWIIILETVTLRWVAREGIYDFGDLDRGICDCGDQGLGIIIVLI